MKILDMMIFDLLDIIMVHLFTLSFTLHNVLLEPKQIFNFIIPKLVYNNIIVIFQRSRKKNASAFHLDVELISFKVYVNFKNIHQKMKKYSPADTRNQ